MNSTLIKLISRVTLLGAMILLTSVGVTHAQTLADRTRFNIPFDFAFGEKKLSAGEYSIGRVLSSSGDATLSIADGNGRAKAFILSQAAVRLNATNKATLVFHRYGDEYFLVQVWPAGAVHGREFPESKLERGTQKQLASNRSAVKEKYQTVTVVANLR